MTWIATAVIGSAIIGGAASKHAGDRASDVSEQAAQRSDLLEREKFQYAQEQADRLRAAGQEASAVAQEEAIKAELGAERFENLSMEYAQSAEDFAARREQMATDLYTDITSQAGERQQAGQDAAGRIRESGSGLMDIASQNEQRLMGAYGDVESRYSPFVDSERASIGQLGAEMGLSTGETSKRYRDTPAYTSAMEAIDIAEQDAMDSIRQETATAGNLYSGSRGVAVADRARRGGYDKANVEGSYYQNYMNLLQDMAQPRSTGAVSQAQLQTARDVAQGYSQAGRDSAQFDATAEGVGLDTMRTGREGIALLPYAQTGTEGANLALGGMASGTEGSPYRLGAEDYLIQGEGGAGSTVLSSMPTGDRGSAYRMQGTAAQNAALADIARAGGNVTSALINRPQPVTQPNYYNDIGYNPAYYQGVA